MLLARRCVHPMVQSRLLSGVAFRGLTGMNVNTHNYKPLNGQQNRQFSKILPSTSHSDENIKIITKEWIDKWVLGLHLCPFATPVVKQNKVRMVVKHGTLPKEENDEEVAKFLGEFISEAVALAGKQAGMEEVPNAHDCDTTLIIVPKMKDYDEFKLLVEVIESHLDRLRMSPLICISSYHPLYKINPRFKDGEVLDTPVDVYTKRSPYPIIQILKLAQVHKECKAYMLKHNPPAANRGRVKHREKAEEVKITETMDRIASRNVAVMRDIGLAKVRGALKDIYADAPINKNDKTSASSSGGGGAGGGGKKKSSKTEEDEE